jgi:hypothetical protein
MKIRLLVEREEIDLQQSFIWFCNKNGAFFFDEKYLVARFMLPWVPWCRLSFCFQAGALETITSAFHKAKPSRNLLLYAAELFQVSVKRKRNESRKKFIYFHGFTRAPLF